MLALFSGLLLLQSLTQAPPASVSYQWDFVQDDESKILDLSQIGTVIYNGIAIHTICPQDYMIDVLDAPSWTAGWNDTCLTVAGANYPLPPTNHSDPYLAALTYVYNVYSGSVIGYEAVVNSTLARLEYNDLLIRLENFYDTRNTNDMAGEETTNDDEKLEKRQ